MLSDVHVLVTASAEVRACPVCGMGDPPPDPTCRDGWDHRVGTAAGCPYCGRLQEACARRPCFGSLHQAATTAQLVRLQPAGNAARSGQGRPVTAGFDPAMPNTARVYSRLLGGKDHFPPDRAEADVLLGIYPPLAEMVKENRAFIAEAVTWAANEGIGQFLDLGAGLTVSPAVHQTARAVLPGIRVARVACRHRPRRSASSCSISRPGPLANTLTGRILFTTSPAGRTMWATSIQPPARLMSTSLTRRPHSGLRAELWIGALVTGLMAR